jgi:hypothetical protein
MPSCSEMDRMESDCDQIIRRESGPTSGGFWRCKCPLTAFAAGDVRQWGNSLNGAAGILWYARQSEGQGHRWIDYTLKAVVKSGCLEYAVTRYQSSRAQARCGETRPPGFWKGGVLQGTLSIRLQKSMDKCGHRPGTAICPTGAHAVPSPACSEILGGLVAYKVRMPFSPTCGTGTARRERPRDHVPRHDWR